MTGLFIAIGIILFPTNAFAFGPVTHVDISMQLLSGAVALGPTVLRLIRAFPLDFTYGSVAADIIVGKNTVQDKHHCHSWAVAMNLLRDAQDQGERRHAFMLGYIAHLAADVVAHNHFVPGRLVGCYRAKGVGHLYWEARFDQKLLERSPALLRTWSDLEHTAFGEHDAFLYARLVPGLFSHSLSSHLFRRSLILQRNGPWRGALERIDARSRLPLSVADAERWCTAAVSLAALAINDPQSAALRRWDPTGQDAIHLAISVRRLLRQRSHRKDMLGGLLDQAIPSVPPPSLWHA